MTRFQDLLIDLATRPDLASSGWTRVGVAQRAALLQDADRECIFLPLVHNLGDEVGALPAAWQREFSRRVNGRGERLQLARWLSDRLYEAGIQHAFLKGFALETLHGLDYWRQFDDLDIALAHTDALWPVVDLLRQSGFHQQSMAVRQCPRTSAWAVATKFRRPSLRDPLNGAKIELITSAQPLFWSSNAPFCRAFWDRCGPLVARGGIPVPSRVDQFLVLIGEFLERRRLTLRDALDASALEQGFTEADVELAQTKLVARSLVSQYWRYRAMVDGEKLPRVGSARILWDHAWPNSLALGGRCASILRTGAVALLDQAVRGGPQRKRLAQAAVRLIRPRTWKDAGIYLQAVPVDDFRSPSLRWQDQPTVLLRTPAGTYRPSPLALAHDTEGHAGASQIAGQCVRPARPEDWVWIRSNASAELERYVPASERESWRREVAPVHVRGLGPEQADFTLVLWRDGRRLAALSGAKAPPRLRKLQHGSLQVIARGATWRWSDLKTLTANAFVQARRRGWALARLVVPADEITRPAELCGPAAIAFHDHVVVCHTLDEPSPVAAPRTLNASIRRARDGDKAFLIGAFSSAIEAGLSPWETYAAWPDAVAEEAKLLLASILSDDVILLVAEVGVPVGMAAASARATDALTGLGHARLYDAWTDLDHRGQGIASALTECVEQEARARGARVILATARRPTLKDTLGLVDELAGRGWHPVRAIWTFAIR